MRTLLIITTLVTNWTGFYVGSNELGYVATNHVAIVAYDGRYYTNTLKTTIGDRAVWRAYQLRIESSGRLQTDMIITNNVGHWLLLP